MIPAHIVVLDALPTTLSGKVDFSKLPLPTLSESDNAAISDDPLLLQLAQLWQQVLGVPVDNPDTHFFDMGGHSLLLVQLLARIQESFHIEMPLEKLFQHATLSGMARQIQLILTPEASPVTPSAYSPLLAVLRDTGTHYPLFCIAPAGGTTHPYFALAHALGADYPVFAIQDIAFATDAAPLPTIEAMASKYIEVMREVQPHGPYHLAGWSFGGNVAYEMAQQLQAAGEAVLYIGMIEAFPTIKGEIQKPRVNSGVKGRLSRIKHHLVSMIMVGIDGLAATVAPLRREEDPHGKAQTRWQRWTNTLAWHLLLRNSDMNALLDKDDKLALIHQPMAGQFMTIAGANLKALKEYEMKSFSGDIVLYVGLHDPALADALDWAETWKKHVTGNISVHIHHADHFSIMRPPAIVGVAVDARENIKKRPTQLG
jgi:thioesterase domain-containing protein/acyl carrier protein